MYYYMIADSDSELSPTPEDQCVLYFNRTKSISVKGLENSMDTLSKGINGGGKVVYTPNGEIKWFNDIGSSIFIETINIDGFGNYVVVEDYKPINWEINFNIERQIGSLKCNEAIGKFRGRTYTAWFCPEIPFSHGPWKLHGLPGLIVEAYDETREVRMLFKSLTIPLEVEHLITKPNIKKAITRKEFVVIESKKINDMIRAIEADLLLSGDSDGTPGESFIFKIELEEK
jgi:GLPGLI family protein